MRATIKLITYADGTTKVKYRAFPFVWFDITLLFTTDSVKIIQDQFFMRADEPTCPNN